MTQLLINEGTLFHNILLQETQRNMSRIKQTMSMTKNLNGLFDDFSGSLHKFCRQIFKKSKTDEDEDQSIVFLVKFIVDLLVELTKKINQITKKINNEIRQPLEQFSQSQQQSYKQILQKSGQQLASIEVNSYFLNQLTKNFNLNKIMDLNELEKSDLKKIYEIQMEKCNEKWLVIKKGYQQILSDGNSINSFRCNFMVKSQVKLCKQINKFINSVHVDESLTSYEQLSGQNQLLSLIIKDKIKDRLGKSILLEEKTMQNFDGQNNFAYKQKIIIDDFISMFTSFSNVKDEEKKHEKARSLILENWHWSQYFLARMRSNLHTEIKLPAVKYHEMTTIIKYLFAMCAENEQNQQILYNLLYISYRMTYNGNYIIKELGKHELYWRNSDRWKKLIQFMRGTRDEMLSKKLHIPKKYIPNSSNRYDEKFKNAVKNGLLWISPNLQPNPLANKIGTDKRIKSQKTIIDAKTYEIVCEMNYFMARLELEEKFIFQFMVNTGNYYEFSLQNIKKLLKFHYFNKQNNIDNIKGGYLKRKRRLEEKYKNLERQKKICVCVGKSLKYLQPSPQLLSLRLVNKLWCDELRQKISTRFLIQEPNQLYLTRNRLNLYTGICPSILTKKIFERMVQQLPEFTEHSDIISLDAKRSLSWDEGLRQKLTIVLTTFAFYHPNVGYLQGMNYLCENILKITDDTYTTYNIFEYLMNNQFYGMYSANFDGLKMKIYQFMRIVQRQKPKLYSHFMSEKLEGEHFLLPWAITLWGEMSGDLVWLMWDGFICKGWKWWIKTGLWLLHILEPELLNMNFEQMMKTFSELGTGLLNMNSKELTDFGINFNTAKQQIDKIPVHRDTLKQIQKQYKLKVEMVNQYIKKVKEHKKH